MRPIIKLGCVSPGWIVPGTRSACSQWYAWAVARARAIHPALLLLVNEYEAFAPDVSETAKGLATVTTFVRRVRSATRQLLVVGDAPGVPGPLEPGDCLQRAHATMRSCSATETQSQLNATAQVAGVAETYGAFLDTTPWFCAQDRCPMVVAHTVVYADNNHMTAVYAEALAPLFQEALDRLIASGAASTRHR